MANKLFNKQIDILKDRIYAAANNSFNSSIHRRMKTLRERLEFLQQDFFTSLATSISGASGPPRLGAYTPFWKPLSDSYTERREFTQDVAENEYFRFSGKLETTLSKLNPKTFLGIPVISYKQGGVTKRLTENYKAPASSKGVEVLRARIEIDLFPKIAGAIEVIDEAELFDGVKLTWISERRGKKTTTTPISYRLKNYQGAGERPIMEAYLKWWLNVKAKREVRKVIR